MGKRTTLLAVAVLFMVQLFAQTTRTVTGTVTDDKGSTLAGATIKAVGTSGKVISIVLADAVGKFSIKITDKTKGLQVSYVGMEEQFVPLTSNLSNVVVKLITPATGLDEVVVTGYGAAKKKAEVPGSVSTVKADVLQEKPAANMLDALQGKVPGLQIFSSSGEPSSTPSIRLNGVGSLTTDPTPLFVMDGIPIDPGTILSLNPEDFEEITVLRDAAATSIYGARAANGVILLTSKKGSIRSSKISLTTQYGLSNLTNNTTDYYNSFMNAAQFKSFLVDAGIYTQTQLDNILNSLPYKNADTKWYKVFYKSNTPTYSADLNISGGSGKTTYYLSGSYFNQDGLAYRSGYNRYTFRSNINTTVNNWFQMGINLFGGYDERQTNPYGANQLNRGLSLLLAPYYSNIDQNGVEYPQIMTGSNRYNPKYLANEIKSTSNNTQLNPTGYIQLTPVKGLTLKSTGGIEFYDYRTTSVNLPSYAGGGGVGAVGEAFTRGSTKTITNTAEYKLTVAQRHNITALAGQEYISSTTTAFNANTNGQTDDRTILLQQGVAANTTVGSSESQYSFFSLFGRLDYNFDSKYFLDLSIRNDQSSRFGENLKAATFYSAGASWSAKKESFLRGVNWLNDLIVKASIGTTGNSAIGNYDHYGLVGTTTNYAAGTAWTVASAGNALLSWEHQRQINFGFQATLIKRIHIDAEYFDRKTTSMLYNVPFPFTSGFANIESNVGGLTNTGVNAKISLDIVNNKNSFLNVYADFGIVKQKVSELFQGNQFWVDANTGVGYGVGQAVKYVIPIWAGVDPATGNALWYQPNPDPKKIMDVTKDPTNVTSLFNSTSLQQNSGRNVYPPFNGGFGLSGGYKGFYANADFTFSQGKYVLNNDEYFFNNPYQFAGYNQVNIVTDYWKKPGDVTRYPKLGVQFTQFDSRLIENASFMRLKNLTVGYNFPKELVSKTKAISAVKLFVTFRNIWTLTKYPGPDPEDDTNVTLGIDPNTTQTSVGLNIQF